MIVLLGSLVPVIDSSLDLLSRSPRTQNGSVAQTVTSSLEISTRQWQALCSSLQYHKTSVILPGLGPVGKDPG